MSQATDLDKPVQTREGNEVRIICKDAKGDRPIVALVKDRNSGLESVITYFANGCFCSDAGPSSLDLINRPERKSLFLPVFGPHLSALFAFRTLAEASAHAKCKVVPPRSAKAYLELVFEDDELVEIRKHLPFGEDNFIVIENCIATELTN